MDYIKELLKDYGDNPLVDSMTDSEEEIINKYVFSSGKNEELVIVTRSSKSNEKFSNMGYTCKKDQKVSSISDIRLSFSIIENANKYSVNYSTDDSIEFKKVSEIIDGKVSPFLDLYNKVAKNMLIEKDLNLKYIEQLTDIKPDRAESIGKDGDKEYKIFRDRYTNGIADTDDYEYTSIIYANDVSKFRMLMYQKENKDANISIYKSTYIDYDSINNKVSSSIGLSVDNVSEQEKLLNKILKF
jgi:hypothetical protein